MSTKKKSEKKCIAIHLPVDLLDKISRHKEKTGKSQNSLLTELIEKGLDIAPKPDETDKTFFFVKVRIDIDKMMELGQKLQSGELDTSHTIMTYCIKDDPSVGISFWQAENKKRFENAFAPHRTYYKEVMEIIPVTTPGEAMKRILQETRG